ncbi:MAG: hypothetical protein ACKVN8_06190 [Nitrosarchaeum sp.]
MIITTKQGTEICIKAPVGNEVCVISLKFVLYIHIIQKIPHHSI